MESQRMHLNCNHIHLIATESAMLTQFSVNLAQFLFFIQSAVGDDAAVYA